MKKYLLLTLVITAIAGIIFHKQLLPIEHEKFESLQEQIENETLITE